MAKGLVVEKGKVTLVAHNIKGEYSIRELKMMVSQNIGFKETRNVEYFENVDLLIKDEKQVSNLIKVLKKKKEENKYILLIGYEPKVHNLLKKFADYTANI